MGWDNHQIEAKNKPPRKKADSTSVLEAAQSPAGGKMAKARLAAAETADEFISIRSQLGATKIMVAHFDVLRALWKLSVKLASRELPREVSFEALAGGVDMAQNSLRAVLNTLVKNQIVKALRTSVGFSSTRVAYEPTELGIQIISLVEFFGMGTSIQIGRTPEAWKSRTQTEPENFFRYADLIKGDKIRKGTDK